MDIEYNYFGKMSMNLVSSILNTYHIKKIFTFSKMNVNTLIATLFNDRTFMIST